jgi:hypothetical protein
VTVFLIGFYFLIALGLALTRNRYVDATALNLRQAARRVWPAAPHYAVRALQGQLLIAAAGFGILALRPVPLALVELVSAVGCAAAIPVIWPAMMSIFAAALGGMRTRQRKPSVKAMLYDCLPLHGHRFYMNEDAQR